jgi:hypothetical protein
MCSIDDLAHEFGIRRRGLYDFISICCTFGICRRSSNNTIEWISVNRMLHVVTALRIEAQAESGESDIKRVFNYSLDFSLQRIARALVKLFFYLHVKFIDLRRVSRLFAQRNTKYKTMLRKVYTVATGLEILGIVRNTSVVSEIQLKSALDSENCTGQLKVSSILNTQEQLENERVCARRRREFTAVCEQLADVQRVQQVPDAIKPVFPSLARWGLV